MYFRFHLDAVMISFTTYTGGWVEVEVGVELGNYQQQSSTFKGVLTWKLSLSPKLFFGQLESWVAVWTENKAKLSRSFVKILIIPSLSSNQI